MCLSTKPTSKWHFVPGVLKFWQLGFLQHWGPITLRIDLWLLWGLKQSCSPSWELSNGVLHATCTQGNQGGSQRLVIGNQTTNLTPGLSFGHNLCFKCSNGSCEPILDIYVLSDFQWYKERLHPLSFDPCNYSWKTQKSNWDSNSQDESSRGNVKVHSLTLFCTPGSMRCDFRASLLAHALASPCLGRDPRLGLWQPRFVKFDNQLVGQTNEHVKLMWPLIRWRL
jgi:hypothetical protein